MRCERESSSTQRLSITTHQRRDYTSCDSPTEHCLRRSILERNSVSATKSVAQLYVTTTVNQKDQIYLRRKIAPRRVPFFQITHRPFRAFLERHFPRSRVFLDIFSARLTATNEAQHTAKVFRVDTTPRKNITHQVRTMLYLRGSTIIQKKGRRTCYRRPK